MVKCPSLVAQCEPLQVAKWLSASSRQSSLSTIHMAYISLEREDSSKFVQFQGLPEAFELFASFLYLMSLPAGWDGPLPCGCMCVTDM